MSQKLIPTNTRPASPHYCGTLSVHVQPTQLLRKLQKDTDSHSIVP